MISPEYLSSVKRSATLAINERSAQLQSQGRDIVRFGFGQSPFPVPSHVIETLRERAGEKDYLPVLGLPELRAQVAEFHRSIDKLSIDQEQIIIGPGSKELMVALMFAVDCDLMIPAPAWVSYEPQAALAQRNARRLRAAFDSRWRVTPDLIRDAATHRTSNRPMLMVLNYPGNPDGLSYSESELIAIAETCRKFNIIVLSDEIYGRLRFDGQHISLARFYPEGTIVTSGLSKWCGAGGWRLGTMAIPESLDSVTQSIAGIASETFSSVCAPVQYAAVTIAGIASETFSSVCAPVQYAAVTAYTQSPEIDTYLDHQRQILQAVSSAGVSKLQDAGLKVHLPVGGFYAFLDFTPFRDQLVGKGIPDSATLCQTLLDTIGVALLPGDEFGLPSEYYSARLAFVDFDGAAALKALATEPITSDFVHRYCARTLDGFDRLASWFSTLG